MKRWIDTVIAMLTLLAALLPLLVSSTGKQPVRVHPIATQHDSCGQPVRIERPQFVPVAAGDACRGRR
jgi:hypothetical protein